MKTPEQIERMTQEWAEGRIEEGLPTLWDLYAAAALSKCYNPSDARSSVLAAAEGADMMMKARAKRNIGKGVK